MHLVNISIADLATQYGIKCTFYWGGNHLKALEHQLFAARPRHFGVYRFKGKSTRDVNDDTFAFLQMWHCELSDLHHRADIKFDHVLKGVHQLGIVDAAKGTCTGVVDLSKQVLSIQDIPGSKGFRIHVSNDHTRMSNLP